MVSIQSEAIKKEKKLRKLDLLKKSYLGVEGLYIAPDKGHELNINNCLNVILVLYT